MRMIIEPGKSTYPTIAAGETFVAIDDLREEVGLLSDDSQDALLEAYAAAAIERILNCTGYTGESMT